MPTVTLSGYAVTYDDPPGGDPVNTGLYASSLTLTMSSDHPTLSYSVFSTAPDEFPFVWFDQSFSSDPWIYATEIDYEGAPFEGGYHTGRNFEAMGFYDISVGEVEWAGSVTYLMRLTQAGAEPDTAIEHFFVLGGAPLTPLDDGLTLGNDPLVAFQAFLQSVDYVGEVRSASGPLPNTDLNPFTIPGVPVTENDRFRVPENEPNGLYMLGAGNDYVEGSDASESFYGGDGNDTVFTGAGFDYVEGGTGDDVLINQGGAANFYAQDGNDLLVGADGFELLNGGVGEDDYFPGFGTDEIDLSPDGSGESDGHRDRVFGTVGELDGNYLRGFGMEDQIILLNGAAGGGTATVAFNDSEGEIIVDTNGDAVTDLVIGAGDLFSRPDVTAALAISLVAGTDHLVIHTGATPTVGPIPTIPTPNLGTAAADDVTGGDGNELLDGQGGNDTLNAGAGDDTADGGQGDDSIDAGAGNDSVSGGSGNDSVIAGDGNDVVDGGSGNDTITGGSGLDTVNAGDGADQINGGPEDDVLIGGSSSADQRDEIRGGGGNDLIDGGHGNDYLVGGEGDDTIEGGFGVDTVIGNAGDDVLTGSAWSDLIFGNDGDDFINGGFGSDRVNGGAGADRFFHIGAAGHGSDWIQDYNAAEGDLLRYGGASRNVNDFQVNFANTAGAGDAGTDEAFVIYRPTGQILWALIDGAGQAEINIQIGGTTYDLLA